MTGAEKMKLSCGDPRVGQRTRQKHNSGEDADPMQLVERRVDDRSGEVFWQDSKQSPCHDNDKKQNATDPEDQRKRHEESQEVHHLI